MFQDSVRCIWDSPVMRFMLSDLRSQTHVCRRFRGCSKVRRDDCGQMTAADDVLQTPTGTVRTGTMAPCRASTGKPGHTVWTWYDHWRPASAERRVEDSSDFPVLARHGAIVPVRTVPVGVWRTSSAAVIWPQSSRRTSLQPRNRRQTCVWLRRSESMEHTSGCSRWCALLHS